MQNKTGIIALTIIVSLLCIYYLSFTFVSRKVKKDAIVYATDKKNTLDPTKERKYLDSIWNEPVYNLGFAKFTYKEVKENELALGLDLQGGMHVVLEVSPIDIIKAMSNNPNDPKLLEAISLATKRQATSQEKFVNLFGKAYKEVNKEGQLGRLFASTANKDKIQYTSSDESVLKAIDQEIEAAIDRSFEVLRKRVDKFGVANPNIQKLPGTGRIQIELPDEKNPQRVRKLLSGVAKLEFWEVWELQEIAPYLEQLNTYLIKTEDSKAPQKNNANPFANNTPEVNKQQNPFLSSSDSVQADSTTIATADSVKKDGTQTPKDQLAKADSIKKDSAATTQSSVFAQLFQISQEGLAVRIKDTARVNALLNKAEVKSIFPNNLKFLWAAKPEIDRKTLKELDALVLYAIKKGRDGNAPLGGEVVEDARQDFDQYGKPEISMRMNIAGAKKWRKLTSDNIGRRLAIVLDDYVYSAPSVNQEIPNGNSSISGSFTLDEAKDLGNILKAGKLPAPTRIVEEAVVGPSLGAESIKQGLISMVAGIVLVIIFIFVYYNSGGMVANIALVINIFFIIGILAQFGASLTLPGIAGIVLTVGMSVDANVLIFERIREELRLGRPMKMAIDLGFDKAYSSIIDSNVTTFLIGVILYSFGAGGVQGFAVVLMIGIVCSLFTAVFITRLIVEAMSKDPNKISLRFDTPLSKKLFKNANFDFVGNRKKAYFFSTILIAIGLISIPLQGGLNLGVDFKGGRSYIVKFDQAVPASEIRTNITQNFGNKGTEVKTFGSDNQLKITTSYLIDDESEEADRKVEAALKQGLSKFNASKPEIVSSSKVGATIADDIRGASQIAIFISLIAIFLYILIRFQKWQYGLGAVIALAHDVLMIISFYSLAHLIGFNFEIDQVFIAAILTVIGYSINDTVVVFDRIREFMRDNTKIDLATNLNSSINETLSRTVITALTTFIVVIVLLLFGGETLRGFSFSLAVGIIFGTYSSIFIASPIVLEFTKKKEELAPATLPVEKVKKV